MPKPAQHEAVQENDTLNRYLLTFQHNSNIDADVISFTATECLSQPYCYSIKFSCTRQNLPLNEMLNCNASFILRAPNPHKSWDTDPKWDQLKQVNGIITSFARIDSSPDEAVYECMLEHELALLNKTKKSAVYLNVSVPDLVKQVMLEHREIESYKIDFDKLIYAYSAREMVIQWQETDLQFILRLLSEVGIWFRFENHPKIHTEVITVFGDSDSRYIFSENKIPYVRNSGMTSANEYVTELKESYSVIPDSVLSRNYNYRDPFTHSAEKSVHVPNIPDSIKSGREYHYADKHLSTGDIYARESDSATFNARIRHENLLNDQSVFSAITNDPSLSPGWMFYPEGNVSDGFKRGFVVCRTEVSGSRGEHFIATLHGIPYSESYCFRPQRLPRPVIAGTLPARVSIREQNGLYASTDKLGRYIVKFDFDLDEKKKGYESAFVRLGRPYAGDTYGMHFPLLEGVEVAIAFEYGDPDRPFISHVLHDGRHPDLVTMYNDTRNVIRTPSFNKIRLEDKRDQEHIKLSTEYGKSQLNTGHMVDSQRKKRGEGLEGRTDHWVSLRGAKGLLLTTEAQPRAQGQQLDMAAAIASLEGALALAKTLQQCATTAGASSVDTQSQQSLQKVLDHLTGPAMLAYSDAGQAHITPSTLQLSAGKDWVATSGSNASISVLKKFSLAVGDKISLFARKLGIQMIAGAGDVVAQAQQGGMHLLSHQDFTLSSTDGKTNVSAKQGIQLTCGGGGIRINADGSVEIFSPTGIDLKGPNLAFKGPESVKTTVPAFKNGAFKLRFKLHAADNPEQGLPEQKFRLKSETGEILEGVTDAEGHSALFDSVDLNTYKMELL